MQMHDFDNAVNNVISAFQLPPCQTSLELSQNFVNSWITFSSVNKCHLSSSPPRVAFVASNPCELAGFLKDYLRQIFGIEYVSIIDLTHATLPTELSSDKSYRASHISKELLLNGNSPSTTAVIFQNYEKFQGFVDKVFINDGFMDEKLDCFIDCGDCLLAVATPAKELVPQKCCIVNIQDFLSPVNDDVPEEKDDINATLEPALRQILENVENINVFIDDVDSALFKMEFVKIITEFLVPLPPNVTCQSMEYFLAETKQPTTSQFYKWRARSTSSSPIKCFLGESVYETALEAEFVTVNASNGKLLAAFTLNTRPLEPSVTYGDINLEQFASGFVDEKTLRTISIAVQNGFLKNDGSAPISRICQSIREELGIGWNAFISTDLKASLHTLNRPNEFVTFKLLNPFNFTLTVYSQLNLKSQSTPFWFQEFNRTHRSDKIEVIKFEGFSVKDVNYIVRQLSTALNNSASYSLQSVNVLFDNKPMSCILGSGFNSCRTFPLSKYVHVKILQLCEAFLTNE